MLEEQQHELQHQELQQQQQEAVQELHQQQQENGTNGPLAKVHASEKVTHILSRQVVVAPAALSPRHCSGRSC
jgi:orotidine-5'-phosphate decarboxylase